MASQSIPRLTEDEYLDLDRANKGRSEYIDGNMLAMAGGSVRHSELAAKLLHILMTKLTGRECTVFNSDVRVNIPAGGACVYPDVSVVCGPILLKNDSDDILLNPVLIGEVLSPATRNYDQGRKFELYRGLRSLKEYLIVHFDSVRVQHYSRQDDDTWLLRESVGKESTIAISALAITINVDDLYRSGLTKGVQ